MYTRVFECILDSSLNVQRIPPSCRWLWITMLLIADKNRTGVVDMPIERLASRAGLTLDQTNEALALLSAPDIESSSDEENGRRIVPIREDSTRGWRLVNWQKYRDIITEEQRREQTRRRVAEHRDRNRSVTIGNADVTKTNTSEAATASATEATAQKKSKTPSSPKKTAKELVEEFMIEDKHREWAAKNTPSVPIDEELEAWKDRERANEYTTGKAPGIPVRDAAAAFRTAMRNAEKWGTYRNQQQRMSQQSGFVRNEGSS